MAFARLGDAPQAWRAWCSVSPAHRHGLDAEGDAPGRVPYGLEPYAVAADVYAEAPWAGRGGWSWYTGAAGWLYRAAVESLLGVQRQGSRVRFTPVLPPGWPAVCVTLRWQGRPHRFTLGPDAAAAAAPDAKLLAAGVWVDLAAAGTADDWVVSGIAAAPGPQPREEVAA
jgi:cyclic beta-1,2-glucan synthetase